MYRNEIRDFPVRVVVVKSLKITSLLILLASAVLIRHMSCSDIRTVESDEDWSFVLFGDVRQGFGVYGKLCLFMSGLKPTPSFSICLGDIMGTAGNEIEWVNFWHHSKPVTDIMPMYMVRGNHEGNDEACNRIYKEQNNMVSDTFYFTFTHANAFFIILDTYIRNEENKIGTEQFAWLIQQLDSASQDTLIDHIFISMHHPVFPRGKYQDCPMKNGNAVHSLFLQHPKIRCVFVSHDHLYNKFTKDGILYITSGGAGAPLYHGYGGDFYHFLKISMYTETGRIHVKTIGIFNKVLEEFYL